MAIRKTSSQQQNPWPTLTLTCSALRLTTSQLSNLAISGLMNTNIMTFLLVYWRRGIFVLASFIPRFCSMSGKDRMGLPGCRMLPHHHSDRLLAPSPIPAFLLRVSSFFPVHLGAVDFAPSCPFCEAFPTAGAHAPL